LAPPACFIGPDDLEGRARQFLEQHNPAGEVPVPIDLIAERGLGLDIIPMPRLKEDFDTDGFLAFGRSIIYVDQAQFERYEVRYRNTLAHEIGHLLPHADLYAEAGVNDLESYVGFYESLEVEYLGGLEFQARNLGGRILMPRKRFIEVARAELEPLSRRSPRDPTAGCCVRCWEPAWRPSST
jgi:hypothetical protein